jgi:predicted ATP-dependent endonuclease of OLD family
MRIAFVEIANFRKLRSIRVELAADKTVFVGANNSGKTSAMVALRYFLLNREHGNFSLNDFTLSHWPTINAMGANWETSQEAEEALPAPDWNSVLPALDVWLHVEDHEIHYVQKILPTLDWTGGLIGVRLRLQPKDVTELQKEYLARRSEVVKILKNAAGSSAAQTTGSETLAASLWPQNLTEFIDRRIRVLFEVRAYVLDSAKCVDPTHGEAIPQSLAANNNPIEGDPFKGLVRIDEISAQRGFGEQDNDGVASEGEEGGAIGPLNSRKLSEQFRRYYRNHLNPLENPNAEDLAALKAIEDAQKAFDAQLKNGFKTPLKEMEKLGYPGVTDPRLSITTRLRPVDGLKHDAAVQYVVDIMKSSGPISMYLPENSNGLGYQNLISMVFRLMSFRDAWMRVGKAQVRTVDEDIVIPPLHLVLIEEPEAHLHTQVQQVFIRQAYKILRLNDQLGEGTQFTTQLVVSTHSSHVAHECKFASLRYFRRMPASNSDIPVSRVVNLTEVFGTDNATERFATRYLKVTHCDLFFADAAVFVEGPAERILIPLFIDANKECTELKESYITWLEIGGSHAHRLKAIVERLGLTTLIVTDLDARGMDGKSAPPERSKGQKSGNPTLKNWWPGEEDLDILLGKTAKDRVKDYLAEQFKIMVTYQGPIALDSNKFKGEALANTFEDALVFQNLDFFKDQSGTGLLAKFKSDIDSSGSIADLGKALWRELQKGAGKIELALDLLEVEPPESLKVPEYIREGLLWLRDQLTQHKKELGLASPTEGGGIVREVS